MPISPYTGYNSYSRPYSGSNYSITPSSSKYNLTSGHSGYKTTPTTGTYLSGNTASLKKTFSDARISGLTSDSVVSYTDKPQRKYYGGTTTGFHANRDLYESNKDSKYGRSKIDYMFTNQSSYKSGRFGEDLPNYRKYLKHREERENALKPKDIDASSICVTGKPPKYAPRSTESKKDDDDDASISRYRQVVRLTIKRDKPQGLPVPPSKTVAERLLEKYALTDDASSNSAVVAKPPLPDKNAIKNNRSSRRSSISKPNIPNKYMPDDKGSDGDDEDSDSDETEDFACRYSRATEAASSKPELQDAEEVKDAILAVVLHPSVDIESDEEIKRLVDEDSDETNIPVNENKNKNSNLSRSLKNRRRQSDVDIGGEILVKKLKRFVKNQVSLKKESIKNASRKSSVDIDLSVDNLPTKDSAANSEELTINNQGESEKKEYSSKVPWRLKQETRSPSSLNESVTKKSPLKSNNFSQASKPAYEKNECKTRESLSEVLHPERSVPKETQCSGVENHVPPFPPSFESTSRKDLSHIPVSQTNSIENLSEKKEEIKISTKNSAENMLTTIEKDPKKQNEKKLEKLQSNKRKASKKSMKTTMTNSTEDTNVATKTVRKVIKKKPNDSTNVSTIKIKPISNNTRSDSKAGSDTSAEKKSSLPQKSGAVMCASTFEKKITNTPQSKQEDELNAKPSTTLHNKDKNSETSESKNSEGITAASQGNIFEKKTNSTLNDSSIQQEIKTDTKKPRKVWQKPKIVSPNDEKSELQNIMGGLKSTKKSVADSKKVLKTKLEDNTPKSIQNELTNTISSIETQKTTAKISSDKADPNVTSLSKTPSNLLPKVEPTSKIGKEMTSLFNSGLVESSNSDTQPSATCAFLEPERSVSNEQSPFVTSLSPSQSADSAYGSSPSTPQPPKSIKNMEETTKPIQPETTESCEDIPANGAHNEENSTSSTSTSPTETDVTTTDEGETTETESSDYSGPEEIIPPIQTAPEFRHYTVKDFRFLKVLGKGSFGKVMLAQQVGAENYFAVKCLKKDVVLEDNDVECCLIERKVLTLATKHPYLCHLFCTFQTPSHLFFVMEYLTGGDLMFHIQRLGRFDEYRACFYAAEILSGLCFLHLKGIIYRDLKLDNILLDYQGHIRIADFGMCKLQIYFNQFADTFCGTPDYMAPEVIKGLHYNQSVDWWSYGVLLYEMMIGKSPFKGCDEDHLFWLICNEEPYYPRYLSREAQNLLKKLLDKDGSTRLGADHSPHGDIKQHPFFKHTDWDKIERKQVETPYKPRLRHILDVQYFDKLFTRRNATLTPLDPSVLENLNQASFTKFTYTNPSITA